MQYLIAGGGIAGTTCARELKYLDPDADITIISEEQSTYARIALPHLIVGTVNESDLELAIDRDIAVINETQITGVYPNTNHVETDRAGRLRYDRLLLATGAEAKRPKIKGIQSPRVFTVRNLADIFNIDTILKEEKSCGRVIIYGAGLVSMELADALVRRGCTVVILVTSGRLLSQILDEDDSRFVKKLLDLQCLEINFWEQIVEISDKPRGINVNTKSGKSFEGDLLIIGKGVQPKTEFLKSSGINIADGILVNEFLETSQEGIYSAGDVCQSYDRVRKQRRLNPLWPVAVEQGKHAALSMAGKMTSYKGSFSRNILQVFGHTIISAGVHKDDAIKIFRQYENNRYAAIYTIDGCMIGFTFINLNVKVGAYLTAIKKSLNIYNLKDILLTGSLSYEHLGASYLPE